MERGFLPFFDPERYSAHHALQTPGSIESVPPRGSVWVWMGMEGVDGSFDAIVFVGYHAREGQGAAIISHTFSGNESIKLNDQVVGETGFNAAIGGEFGVPVVFVSGDQTETAEATQLLGPLETAVVKQAIGYNSAITIHPEKSQEMIRAGVKRGVERRKELKPFKISHPQYSR